MPRISLKNIKIIIGTIIVLGWSIIAIIWIYPDDYDRIFIYGQTHEYQKAVDLLEAKLSKRDVIPEEKIQLLGELYLRLHQPAQTEQLIHNQGLSPVYIDRIINEYQYIKDYPNAARLLEEKRQNAPDTELIDEQLAQTYLRMNDDDKALAVYKEQAQRVNTPEVWEKLAQTYFWKNRWEQGEAALMFAWSLEATSERALVIAQYYKQTKRYRDAERFYILALKKTPSHENRTELALFYLNRKQVRKAVNLIKVIPPEEQTIQTRMAALQIYFKARNKKKVRALLDEIPVYEVPPQQVTTYFLIALSMNAKPLLDSLYTHITTVNPQILENIRLEYAVFRKDKAAVHRITQEEGRGTLSDWQRIAYLHLLMGNIKDIELLIREVKLPPNHWNVVIQAYQDRKDYANLERVLKERQAEDAIHQQKWSQQLKQHYITVAYVYIQQGEIQKVETMIHNKQLSPTFWNTVIQAYRDKQDHQNLVRILEERQQSTPQKKWLVLLAQHYENTQSLELAEKYYIQAIPYYKDPAQGNWELIRFHLRQGNVETAATLTQTLQKKHSLTDQQQVEALTIFIWAGQTNHAMQTLQHIPVEKLPISQLKGYYDLAVFTGHLEKADAILEYQSTHSTTELWQTQYDLALLRGDSTKATAILDQQIKKTEAPLELLEKKFQLHTANLNQSGQITVIEQILLSAPTNEKWLKIADNHYSFHQEYDRAVQFFERLYQQSPTPQLRKILIRTLMLKGEAQKLETLLDSISEQEWDDEYESLAIEAGYATSNYTLLATHLENRYLRKQEESDLMQLPYLFFVLKQEDKELFYREKAFQVNPSISNHIDYVETLFRLKYQQKADESLTPLMKRPQTTKQLLQVANIAESSTAPTHSIKLYHQILKKSPNHRKALKRLGMFHFYRQNYSATIPILERYLQVRPSDFEVLISLVDAYSQSEQTQQGNSVYAKLIEQLSTKSSLTFREQQLLALCYFYRGQPLKGLKIYNQTLQLTDR